MKIAANWSVTEENFPDQRAWIGTLLSALYSVINQLLIAIQGNLSIGDNIAGSIFSQTFTTSATYTTGGWTSITVPWNAGVANPPSAVLVGKVTVPSSQPRVLTTVTATDWTFNAGSSSITINYVAGLANSSTYTINFIAL